MSELLLEVEIKMPRASLEDEMEEQIDINRIIGKNHVDLDINDESEFEYRKHTLNLDGFKASGDYDGSHTILYMSFGVFIIRMPYEQFSAIYEALSHMRIRRPADFETVRVKR